MIEILSSRFFSTFLADNRQLRRLSPKIQITVMKDGTIIGSADLAKGGGTIQTKGIFFQVFFIPAANSTVYGLIVRHDCDHNFERHFLSS